MSAKFRWHCISVWSIVLDFFVLFLYQKSVLDIFVLCLYQKIVLDIFVLCLYWKIVLDFFRDVPLTENST